MFFVLRPSSCRSRMTNPRAGSFLALRAASEGNGTVLIVINVDRKWGMIREGLFRWLQDTGGSKKKLAEAQEQLQRS